MRSFKVLVSGAGLGGLCLAQHLRRAGIDVEIFERDAGPWDRPQGYRLHIDPDGAQALPSSLYAAFEATSMRPHPLTSFVDSSFRELRRTNLGAGAHFNTDRATLRQILLSGLDDIIHYGESLTHYLSDDSGVTAFFASGRSVSGDVLVGADGVYSPVRQQRIPHAQVQDSGVRAIYGRIPLSRASNLLDARTLERVFTVVADERKLFLGVGPVIFPTRPDQIGLRGCDDYLVCIVGGRRELFAHEDAVMRGRSTHNASRD